MGEEWDRISRLPKGKRVAQSSFLNALVPQGVTYSTRQVVSPVVGGWDRYQRIQTDTRYKDARRRGVSYTEILGTVLTVANLENGLYSACGNSIAYRMRKELEGTGLCEAFVNLNGSCECM